MVGRLILDGFRRVAFHLLSLPCVQVYSVVYRPVELVACLVERLVEVAPVGPAISERGDDFWDVGLPSSFQILGFREAREDPSNGALKLFLHPLAGSLDVMAVTQESRGRACGALRRTVDERDA